MANDKIKIIGSTVLITLILAIVGSTQLSVEDMLASGDWHFCEQENSFKQCEYLTNYGVNNSVCKYRNEVGALSGDRCTRDRKYYEWVEMSNFINITGAKKEVIVETIQNCTDHFWNTSEPIWANCSEYINGTWINYTCQNGTIITEHNSTLCEPVGYSINYTQTDKMYELIAPCCLYYNESPYLEFTGELISCKEIVAGVCNPLIQQSSPDPAVYDDVGMIFLIDEKRITSKSVGGYQYVYDNAPYIGKIKEVKT